MATSDFDPKIVRQQLERTLASTNFVRSQRLSRFLRFVVERHLDGHDDELKESVIAMEVFGQGDYDPKQDSIVRTEASRLRSRLAEYYLGEGVDAPVVIELPKGGYIPLIRRLEKAPDERSTLPRRVFLPSLLTGCTVALAATGWWWTQYKPAPIAIAVIPFENLSHEPSSDYFADGLTDEIIRNLSIIEGLAPRSRTSSFAFKGRPRNVHEMGKQLDVEYVLEGSVLNSPQKLRINVQLVRVRDDFPIWSSKFDREMTDIFAIQEEIARGIVNTLRLKLGRGRRRYETSTEAYDLYLRAVANPRLTEKIPLFEQAITKDPSFAPAYAGLARAYGLRSSGVSSDIPAEVAKMRAAAEKAIQLDPLSAESYDALGAAYARDGRWGQSEKSFRRAMDLEPGRAESHTLYAFNCLMPLGRIDESIQELRMAEKSDPLSADVHFWLSDALLDAGRVDEAASACEKLPAEDPHSKLCILKVRLKQGRAAEIIQVYEANPGSQRDLRQFGIGAVFGCAYARAGRREEAEKVAAAIGSNRARIFACLGDKDRVFEALEHDAEIGPVHIGRILNDVNRESPGVFSGDPRLKALRKNVALPD